MIRVPPIHTIPPPHRSDLTATLRDLADTLDAEPTEVAALKLIRMLRDDQRLLASVLWDALQSGDALETLSNYGLTAEAPAPEVRDDIIIMGPEEGGVELSTARPFMARGPA